MVLAAEPVTAPATGEARPSAAGPLAAFTVDVEDWYQSSVDASAPITERVLRNTDRILALLDPLGVKGTFFVQGLVARRFPALVRRLVTEGHDVQSHGDSHKALFEMDRPTLVRELDGAKKSVEDAAGTPVTAFRAADFSILRQNLWSLDVLAELGFRVDSSIFPLRTRRYGIDGWDLGPKRLQLEGGRELLEAPVAAWQIGRRRIPVGGGGYFRLLPFPVLIRGLRSCVREGRPPIVYCHPYEFNDREMSEYRDKVGWRVRLHQGLGRGAFSGRMRKLLSALPFGRLDHVLSNWRVL